MESYHVIFRLYSPLETSAQCTMYDVLDRREAKPVFHSHIALDDFNAESLAGQGNTAIKTLLLIPGEYTRRVDLGIVAGNHKKALQAAPFLVEESLASPLADTHIALHRDQKSGHTRAVTVHHKVLADSLAELLAANITIDGIYPDTEVFEHTGSNRLFLVGNRALLASSKDCVALAEKHLEVYLSALAPESYDENSTANTVYRHESPHTPTAPVPSIVETWTAEESPDHWFPKHCELSDTAINLAQGPYTASTPWFGTHRTLWALAACVYLGFLLLSMTYYGAGWYYDREANSLYGEQLALYQQLFPEDTKIINLRAQFSQHVREMGSENDRDDFSELVYTALEQFQATVSQPTVGLRYLQYQSNPPALSMEMLVPSVTQLDDFEQALTDQGFTARIDSISQEGDEFLGRVQIEARCVQC